MEDGCKKREHGRRPGVVVGAGLGAHERSMYQRRVSGPGNGEGQVKCWLMGFSSGLPFCCPVTSCPWGWKKRREQISPLLLAWWLCSSISPRRFTPFSPELTTAGVFVDEKEGCEEEE